jgi:plasmid maintenance system antidote protein VapI
MRKTSSWLSLSRAKFQLSQELSDDAVAWVGSLELLLAWPEGMADFLVAYQVVDKHRSTSTGVSRSFGLLLREADRLENLGYPAPADALRDYLLERYTRGHLTRKVVLFRAQRFEQSLAVRPWLSQTEAAQLLNVSQGKINSLLRQQLLVGQIRPAGKKGRTIGLITRESVQLLKAKLAVGLSVREVAMQLGIDRHRIAEMIHAQLFASAMQIGHHWLVAPENVAEWLSWLQALSPLPQEHSGWISARKATRQFGPSGAKWVRIVQWVRGGQLSACRACGEPTLRDLHVPFDELRQRCLTWQAEHASQAGYTLQRLGRVLVPGQPVKEVVLRKWIRAGLLHAERRGKAWWIEPREVARFRAAYCLAAEACSLLGVSRSTLMRWEQQQRIRPIYSRQSHTGAGASVYQRDAVENLRIKQIA